MEYGKKNYFTRVSVNDSQADILRNGIYHNSFNAYYDSIENAYCMQHGGNTTPSSDFQNSRILNLPVQTNQGVSPILTLPLITSMSVINNVSYTNINWTIDELKSPQLSSKLEIFNSSGIIVDTLQDILPQRRAFILNYTLPEGNYVLKLTIKDIFNQNSITYSQPYYSCSCSVLK